MSYNSKYKSSKIEEILDSVGGKQDKITDLEAIRSGAEKGATALQSIPSEYVTENELTAKGYATTSALNNKVDKVSGKQLSTEDFTTALKTKLEGLSNYDDTEIENAISSLQTQFNTLVSGDASDAINSFNEIMAFLDGIKDTQDLAGIIASIEQQIAGKQDKITDLDTIRSGSAKGATALQSYTEKYTGTITGIKMNGASKGTSGVVDLGTVITEHQDISGKADKSSLAAVATSGSYNDLSNKPTIPAAVTESTVSGWGFTKNTGTYSKPSTGIPKSDLASAVQTSLGKADTALQSYTEQYKGTVTGVKVNGSTKSPSSGTVDIGNVVTSVKINGTTKSPSSGVVDLGTVVTDISGKQDKLVSGTNIKTINGTSLLGSGDIVISGGGGDYLPLTGGTITGDLTLTDGPGGAGNFQSYTVISNEFFSDIYYLERNGEHAVIMGNNKVEIINGIEQTKASIDWSGDGTKFLSDDGTYKEVSGGSSSGSSEGTPVVMQTSSYIDALQPNVITIITLPIINLYIEDFVTSSSKHDEYTIIFSTSLEEPEAPRMTLPDYIRWANGSIPTLEWHTVYEFSITRDFLKFMPEGEINSVEQSIYKAVLTPFKPVE